MNWAEYAYPTCLVSSQDRGESPHEVTPIGSRVFGVANSLTVSLRKAWARRPQVAIHVSPELWKHAIVNVLDAADFPDWLFTEQERCIGGIPFRLAEVHSNDCNTPVASLHQSFRTVMILIILGIQSRTLSHSKLVRTK